MAVFNTPRRACASAIVYSIFEIAKGEWVKSFFYYRIYIFEKLPNVDTKEPDALDDMLTWSNTIPAYFPTKN